jgi:hypothetical protein
MYKTLIYVDRRYLLAFIVLTFLAPEGVVVAVIVCRITWTFLTWKGLSLQSASVRSSEQALIGRLRLGGRHVASWQYGKRQLVSRGYSYTAKMGHNIAL